MTCRSSTSFASGSRFYQQPGDRCRVSFFPGEAEWKCASGFHGRGSAEVRVAAYEGGGGGSMRWTIASAEGVLFESFRRATGPS